jgi:sodium-dependent dicarboxylate transporter 2/3/5
MAVFWMTEVIPLAVTALLPVVLFPVIGILPAQVVAREFINDSNFLMMGGLIVATAVERCQLHERLALRVLTLVGSKPQWIMLGFMTVTAALSMFISNTATTAMMVPIAQSVIQQLMNGNLKSSAETDLLDVHHPHRQGVTEEKKSLSKTELRVAKGLILGICFAANIGGTGTLTGTPPNLVMAGMLPTLFPDVNLGVNFISWMAFAVPLMCISLLACWMVLCVFFIGCTSPFDDSVNKMMRLRYSGLPKMRWDVFSIIYIIQNLVLCSTNSPPF